MSETQPVSFAPRGTAREIETGLQFQPKFDHDGLIPAIVTSEDDGAVLMFAWMNADALSLTLQTRTAHFWSRSRSKLWRKGEDSGNVLHVQSVRVDCDQDVLWLSCQITGDGKACHTGKPSCFYRALKTSDGGFSQSELETT